MVWSSRYYRIRRECVKLLTIPMAEGSVYNFFIYLNMMALVLLYRFYHYLCESKFPKSVVSYAIFANTHFSIQ